MSGIVGQRGIGQRSGVVGPAASTQPAFFAKGAANQTSPAHGATINFGTEIFDAGGDYDGANTFTAPVDGKYQFNTTIRCYQVDKDNTYTYIQLEINSTARTYNISGLMSGSGWDADMEYYTYTGSILVDLDAGDQVDLEWNFIGGVTCTNISDSSFFSGYLVA